MDGRGNRTSFTLNAQGFPVAMTDAAGKTYQFQLSGTGANTRMARITDPAGRFVEFGYDTNQRLPPIATRAAG